MPLYNFKWKHSNYHFDQAHFDINHLISSIFPNRRPRITFSGVQLYHLLRCFAIEPFPDITLRNELALQLCVQESRVHVWFQNQRAKARKAGTLKCTATKKNRVIPPIYLMSPPSHAPVMRHMYAPTMPLPNLPGPYGPWNPNWCAQYAGIGV